MIHFGLLGCKEHREMCSRGDVKLCQNFHRAGVPPIQWKRNQNSFRKRSTECKSHCTENCCCAEQPECSVKAYKVYAEKRPAEMKTDDAPFLLWQQIMENLETTTCCQLMLCNCQDTKTFKVSLATLPSHRNNSWTCLTLSLESLTRHFLASNGIRWPLALIRNLEERGGLLFTTFRKLVCFENRKMA